MNSTNRLPHPLRLNLCLFGVLLATASAALAATPAPADASGTAPAAVQLSAETLKPALPLDFAKFASDFQSQHITPPWLVVQVGTIETYLAPPPGKNAFVLPMDKLGTFAGELEAKFHPVELSCLMGAKAKFENVTLLNLDKAGKALDYTLPLGQIVYFVARDETEQGIIYSLHYYDSGKELSWIVNPDKDGAYIPVTRPVSVTQDLGAPAESYAILYLSQRVGPPRPDSTAKPLPLYTYLVIRVHKVPAPAAPTGMISGH